MDNASKALIMAGAILISIALVGVGVFIFSTSSNITNSGAQSINAAAAQTTNSTLRNYAGPSVRGSTVVEFMENIKVYNSQDILPNDIVYADGSITDSSKIVANKFYTVTIDDLLPTNSVDGYYDTVKITEN